MAYKSVMTVWDGRDESRAALDMAVALVRAESGHLSILCLGIDRIQPGLYYAGATPAIMTENIELARDEAKASEASVHAILDGSDINWSCRAMVTQISGISHVVGQMARFNDLVVLAQPYGGNTGEEAATVLESAMFQGHAPVLVCPPAGGKIDGKRIVIAWNQSAEAMAAVKAALPLIRKADAVNIAIIDPGAHDEGQADPGAELSTMLARHGAKVTVSVLAKTVPRIAEVLQRHVSDTDSDLLVMGAYGHSRFRESIIGGATRDMLEDVTVPVLMAH
ncbi:MAG: universal stress protein [Rhodobacteraceae bacterium]|nr:universal stress protein [Paracoccaceae bacterium]